MAFQKKLRKIWVRWFLRAGEKEYKGQGRGERNEGKGEKKTRGDREGKQKKRRGKLGELPQRVQQEKIKKRKKKWRKDKQKKFKIKKKMIVPDFQIFSDFKIKVNIKLDFLYLIIEGLFFTVS